MLSKEAAARTSGVLVAIGGHPIRLRILTGLALGPRSVTELTEWMGERLDVVSQHLRILDRAGLVVQEARGRKRIYTIHPDAFIPATDGQPQYGAYRGHCLLVVVHRERVPPPAAGQKVMAMLVGGPLDGREVEVLGLCYQHQIATHPHEPARHWRTAVYRWEASGGRVVGVFAGYEPLA